MRGLRLFLVPALWGALGLAQVPEAPVLQAPVEARQLTVRHQPQAPPYPPLARLAKVQGLVKLRLTVDDMGRVEAVEALDGPPMLRSAAVAYYKSWGFAPVRVEGVPVRARCEFLMPFTLTDPPAEAGETGISQAVLEVKEAPTTAPVSVDLTAFRAEAAAWLSQNGLAVVGIEKADPSRTLFLKLSIQAFKTEDGLHLQNLVGRVSLLADRGLDANAAGKPQRIWFVNHLLGQKGDQGFQNAILDNLRRSLRELAVPPPLGVVVNAPVMAAAPTGGPPPLPSLPAKPRTVDFDFSQIKVKRQPPAPHYPAYAKIYGIQGTVVLVVTIDPTGTPVVVEAQTGPPALLTTAIGYALDWEFEPARLNGVPQFARFKLTMPFKLR